MGDDGDGRKTGRVRREWGRRQGGSRFPSPLRLLSPSLTLFFVMNDWEFAYL